MLISLSYTRKFVKRYCFSLQKITNWHHRSIADIAVSLRLPQLPSPFQLNVLLRTPFAAFLHALKHLLHLSSGITGQRDLCLFYCLFTLDTNTFFFFVFSLWMREHDTVRVVKMHEIRKEWGWRGAKPADKKTPPWKFYTEINPYCLTHPFTLYQTEKLQMLHSEITSHANSSHLFTGLIRATDLAQRPSKPCRNICETWHFLPQPPPRVHHALLSCFLLPSRNEWMEKEISLWLVYLYRRDASENRGESVLHLSSDLMKSLSSAVFLSEFFLIWEHFI